MAKMLKIAVTLAVVGVVAVAVFKAISAQGS
jgi:hypothetical protein